MWQATMGACQSHDPIDIKALTALLRELSLMVTWFSVSDIFTIGGHR
jgi:hypothetical protein